MTDKEFIAHKRISVSDPGPCMMRYLALKGTNWIETRKSQTTKSHVFLLLSRFEILGKCDLWIAGTFMPADNIKVLII